MGERSFQNGASGEGGGRKEDGSRELLKMKRGGRGVSLSSDVSSRLG